MIYNTIMMMIMVKTKYENYENRIQLHVVATEIRMNVLRVFSTITKQKQACKI